MAKFSAIRLHTGAGLGMLPRHMSKKRSGMSEGAGEDVEQSAEEAGAGDPAEAEEKVSSDQGHDDAVEDETVRETAPTGAAPDAELAAKRDRSDDDNDDDDDDDDDAAARSAAASKAAPRQVAKATPEPTRASTKRSRAAKAGDSLAPVSEAEIDSPSKQTLGMLGVVAAATLVMWGIGRAECNYNEVGEGMKPREVNLEERTRTPKDLAFAFQHALASYDFATARKLSTGNAKKLVEQRAQTCQGSACDEKRKLLASKVASVAELLKRTATHGAVRVWSEGGDDGKKHIAILKRDGRNWLVESYQPDTGAPLDLPGDVPAPVPNTPTTAPSTTAPALSGDRSSAMPPGHPPVPGYPVSPQLAPQAPGAAKAPAAGAQRRATGVTPATPAPGPAKPAPAPGAAQPPAP